MSTRIFYFSGTGNSYWIAKTLGSKIDKSVELTAIQTVTEKYEVSESTIGFVLPVYFAAIPYIVKKAIEKLIIKKDAYVFCVVNCGAVAGNALAELTHSVERRGGKVSAGFTMFMPDNSIVFLTPEKHKKMMLEASLGTIDAIAATINHLETKNVKRSELIIYQLLGKVSTWILLSFLGGRQPVVDSKCTGCGKCVSFCPTGNITMKEQRPVFGDRCAHCFGCGHWCSSRALRFGRCKITNKTQWTHPEVTVEELSKANRKRL